MSRQGGQTRQIKLTANDKKVLFFHHWCHCKKQESIPFEVWVPATSRYHLLCNMKKTTSEEKNKHEKAVIKGYLVLKKAHYIQAVAHNVSPLKRTAAYKAQQTNICLVRSFQSDFPSEG